MRVSRLAGEAKLAPVVAVASALAALGPSGASGASVPSGPPESGPAGILMGTFPFTKQAQFTVDCPPDGQVQTDTFSLRIPNHARLVSTSLYSPPGTPLAATAPICPGTTATQTKSESPGPDSDVTEKIEVETTNAPGGDPGGEELQVGMIAGWFGHADMAIDKHPSVHKVEQGEEFTWLVTVTNKGPATAFDVVVVDYPSRAFKVESVTATKGGTAKERKDDVKATWPSIPPGGKRVLRVKGRVTYKDGKRHESVNEAEVYVDDPTSFETDTNSSNDWAESEVVVKKAARKRK